MAAVQAISPIGRSPPGQNLYLLIQPNSKAVGCLCCFAHWYWQTTSLPTSTPQARQRGGEKAVTEGNAFIAVIEYESQFEVVAAGVRQFP